MKLKFVKDAFYDGKCIATAGEVKEISEKDGFASRWIRRGIAVEEKNYVAQEEVKVEEVKIEAVNKAELAQEEKAKQAEIEKVIEVLKPSRNRKAKDQEVKEEIKEEVKEAVVEDSGL